MREWVCMDDEGIITIDVLKMSVTTLPRRFLLARYNGLLRYAGG